MLVTGGEGLSALLPSPPLHTSTSRALPGLPRCPEAARTAPSQPLSLEGSSCASGDRPSDAGGTARHAHASATACVTATSMASPSSMRKSSGVCSGAMRRPRKVKTALLRAMCIRLQ